MSEAESTTSHPTALGEEEIFERMLPHLVETLGVEERTLRDQGIDARFAEDLDADSLDLVELVMNLEGVFGVTIDESELDGIETVRHAIRLIQSK